MSAKKIAAAALAAMMIMSTQVNAEVLRVGSETVYPPFEFLDSKAGEYVGFDIDLIKEVSKRAGFEPVIYSMGLDSLLPALKFGMVDVAVSALTITPERSARVDFTKPYYYTGLRIMTHKDNPDITDIKELEGKTLCTEIGSSGALFSSRIPHVKIRTFNSVSEAFLEINLKGCYAMINDSPVNQYFFTQQVSEDFHLKETGPVLDAQTYGFAVKQGNTALLERLNKALDEVQADGTYEKIHDKWFGHQHH
ncbi:extracellular solute-binding protein family 3 [gut metagenome]|uniref:Extracellular solute-binding protein family 3 n=1 Tax=gut metagenome TaxID=749906 RepID=J9GFH3_9ZZZZ